MCKLTTIFSPITVFTYSCIVAFRVSESSTSQPEGVVARPFDPFWDKLSKVWDISGVLYKDNLLPNEELESLQHHVSLLEQEHDSSRTWKDNTYITELVDPHKYCFISGFTKINKKPGSSSYSHPLHPYPTDTDPDNSKTYQLLPAELYADPSSGNVSIKSYINNLHPTKYGKIYTALESAITSALPLYEDALNLFKYPNEEGKSIKISLRGRPMQFIIGLRNINLLPHTSFPGSAWHIEGLKNEQVAASGIYYFDVDNVPNSQLHFRLQLDSTHTNFTFLDPVIAKTNRIVVFPNIYEHRVDPFTLGNAEERGHRKIFTIFLVDPWVKIVSTDDVYPQQQFWYEKEYLNGSEVISLPECYNATGMGSCTLTSDMAHLYYNLAYKERQYRPITKKHGMCKKL